MGRRDDLHLLLNEPGTSSHVVRERAAARTLRKSRWWQNLIQKTECHYCKVALDASSATMDHIIPVSSGGRSTRGNVVPACKACNTRKKDQFAFEI
ncbi:MAG: hypothetical protein RIQ81_581 [Pseudomonadota bacterium]|jgi:5-methylcytosine-specific restriction endonuclease McrA